MQPPPSPALSARQRGDFQTPVDLARQIWATLDAASYDLIIEPTFGLGSFLATLPLAYRADVMGWEIEPEHWAATRAAMPERFRLHCSDIFAATLSDLGMPNDSQLLVIGNPPWVTNAEQGTLGGRNTGVKKNLKALAGLDALTGKANYDTAEAILLHLIGLVRPLRVTDFALLVKASVVRNLLTFLGQESWIGDFEFHRIDTQHYFGAAVDAGLLKFRLGGSISRWGSCPIFAGIAGPLVREISIVDRRLIYDAAAYRRTASLEAHGVAHYEWRQGVKHDLRDLFELRETEQGLWNRLGEQVCVEDATLYQLHKGSDIFHGRPARFAVPLYQRDLKDTLDDLEVRFPLLWQYLQRHSVSFAARRSRIYRARHQFALFGIGEYTYRRYKVAIGALYDEPQFRLLAPTLRIPVTDDTCYFLATDDHTEAIYLHTLLALDCVREFLLSISAAGEKRRFTKEVLSRLKLPPMSACPTNLCNTLVAQWQDCTAVSVATRRELQAWLLNYRQPVQQLSLFADAVQ